MPRREGDLYFVSEMKIEMERQKTPLSLGIEFIYWNRPTLPEAGLLIYLWWIYIYIEFFRVQPGK